MVSKKLSVRNSGRLAQRKHRVLRKRAISGMNLNDRWIAQHFGELVATYAGKYVAVAHEGIAAIGRSSLQVLEQARAKYPDENPTLVHVPKPKALECLL